MSTKAEQWRKRFQKPQFSPADPNTLNLHSKNLHSRECFRKPLFSIGTQNGWKRKHIIIATILDWSKGKIMKILNDQEANQPDV